MPFYNEKKIKDKLMRLLLKYTLLKLGTFSFFEAYITLLPFNCYHTHLLAN